MIGAENQYNPIEKECLALVFAIQKTQYYLVSQTPNHTRHIKSQSFNIAYDEAIITE